MRRATTAGTWLTGCAAWIAVAASGCYAGLDGDDAVTAGDGADGADGGADDGVGDGADGDGDGDGDDGDDGGGDDGPAAGCDEGPSVAPSPLRRLTRVEYDNTVRDLLGDTTRPAINTFTPDEVGGGFAANAVAPVSATGLDQYAAAAEDLATTFVAEGLDAWIDCPVGDTACVTDFVTDFGRRAFRRPLSPQEVTDYVAVYETGKADFDAATGVRLTVQAMLMSPHFLYHVEVVPEGAEATDVLAVGPFELASRLSFFLWASAPDDVLLDAAEAGALDSVEGIEMHARRLLDDDRAADTIASFHAQWLHTENLADKVKDTTAYPQWSSALASAMVDESPAFADEVIRRGDGTLQTLLTASWTMGDTQLAELYGVAGPAEAWGRIELPPEERAGVLTQTAFLTTNAHAVEASWVYRGKFVRENLLCQPLPAPPPGVEVNEPNDAGRLENPECASCHLMMDPIGQGLDNYDALGVFSDQGASGEITGVPGLGAFNSGPELANQLAESTTVHDCVATQWFRYAARRHESPDDACAITEIRQTFADSGQDLRELMIAVATSEAFRYRTAAE